MGYRVKKFEKKDGSFGFKVLHEIFENGRRVNRGIPKDTWHTLGFSPSSSFEEAKARAQQLNALAHLRRHEARRARIIERQRIEEVTQSAFLPEPLVKEFEETRLFGRFPNGARDKTASYWRAARRVIAELKVEPKDWCFEAVRFYDYFRRKEFSPAYVQKLLRILNLWGSYVARKQEKPFDPIPAPRGVERVRLSDSAKKKKNKQGNKRSAPLTPSMLEAKRELLKAEHYAWLYLSVWCGLRPVEVDGLKQADTWRVEYEGKTPVLYVYQSKLVALEEEERWKPIPLFLPEQKKVLKLLEAPKKRPLAKTLRSHFGERVTTYGGRRGFTDLMLARGQSLEDISVWLGHTTIERTWRSYKNRQRVSFRA